VEKAESLVCDQMTSHNTLFVSMIESVAQRLQESMRESRRLWFFAERASAELLLQELREIF
jgi:GntR family transcriptional regulator, transcriptional repressor for pyruvate dehydrogenase complex